MSKQHFLDATHGKNKPGKPAFGTGTSIACHDLMDKLGVDFPEAHLNAEKMARLAMAGHTELGFDVVMPLFSVCHETAAMGCKVDWRDRDCMPESGPPVFETVNDICIPSDLLTRFGCAVPLKAISLLKKRLGDDAAVCGKVFGPWTQSYHYFGLENFLMMTMEDPDQVRKIMDRLIEVTIQFAQAQIEAGADCILIADHATSDLCSPKAYEEFLIPVHRRLAEAIQAPTLLHICGDTADRIGMIAQTGLDCFHWDTKLGSPEKAKKLAGDRLALMGGISNYKLLKNTPEEIAADAAHAAQAGIHIIGPECAVPLTTPLANLKAIAGV